MDAIATLSVELLVGNINAQNIAQNITVESSLVSGGL